MFGLYELFSRQLIPKYFLSSVEEEYTMRSKVSLMWNRSACSTSGVEVGSIVVVGEDGSAITDHVDVFGQCCWTSPDAEDCTEEKVSVCTEVAVAATNSVLEGNSVNWKGCSVADVDVSVMTEENAALDSVASGISRGINVL